MSSSFSYLWSFQHDAILRQQKGQGSDLVIRSSNANVNVLGLRWLQSRCLLNLCHLVIRWLTIARRNFYQHILVQIYCDCTIIEVWLSFIMCRTCILEPQPPHNIADRNCEYCWSFLFMMLQKVEPFQARDLHDHHWAIYMKGES